MYVLALGSCPFSKQFLVDAMLRPPNSHYRLEEIHDFATEKGILLWAFKYEADTILEAAIKKRAAEKD